MSERRKDYDIIPKMAADIGEMKGEFKSLSKVVGANTSEIKELTSAIHETNIKFTEFLALINNQTKRIDGHDKDLKDHNERIDGMENTQKKIKYWLAGVIAAVTTFIAGIKMGFIKIATVLGATFP
jgi:archaellum component FlaC